MYDQSLRRTSGGKMAGAADIAWSYFDHLNEGRVEDAIALLDLDGSFWNLRTRSTTPTREQLPFIRTVMGHLPMRFTLISAIDGDDRAALEISSRATLPDGWVYENQYCFLISIREGRIFDVREYLDTQKAAELAARRRAQTRPTEGTAN